MEPDETIESARARPGIAPTWSSSAKDAVGTSHHASRVWFTVGHGVLNEIYWPRVDAPQVRDLGFIVADGAGFWSEVKRDAVAEVRSVKPGIPAIVATHRHPRYELTTPDLCRRRCRRRPDRGDAHGHAGRRGPGARDRSAAPLSAAGATPRLQRSPQPGLDRDVQGPSAPLRPPRQVVTRTGLRPPADPAERRLRRRVGRLAGLLGERRDDVDVRSDRPRQRRRDGRAPARR